MNKSGQMRVYLFMLIPVVFFSAVYGENSYSAGNAYSNDYGNYNPVAAVKAAKTPQVKKITKEESIESLRIASEKANDAAEKLLLALDKFKSFAKNENIAPVLPADSTKTAEPASPQATTPTGKNDTTDEAVILPQVALFGQAFIRYTYQNATTGAAPVSAFSVARSYFGVKVTGDGYAACVTMDVPNSSGAQKDIDFGAWLKACYADFNKILPGLTLRAGIQRMYFGTLDTWAYPVIEIPFEDKNKVMGSADQGIAAIWEAPSGYGTVEAAIYNGNGYKKMEDNTEKLYVGSVKILPFAGTQLKDIYARVSYLKTLKNGFDRPAIDLFSTAILLGFKNDICWGHAEYLVRNDGSLALPGKSGVGEGLSFFAGVRIWGPFAANFRFEEWNPDTKTARDEVNTYIAGINYEFNKKVTVQLNWQSDQTKFGGFENYNKILTQVKIDW
jgi:hypothetical protein